MRSLLVLAAAITVALASEEAAKEEESADAATDSKKEEGKSAPFLLDLRCSACTKTAQQVYSSLQGYNATTDVDAAADADGTAYATTVLSGVCSQFIGISITGYTPNRAFKSLLEGLDVLNGGSLDIDALSGNAKDEAQLKALCAEFVSGAKALAATEGDAEGDGAAAAAAAAAATPREKLVKLVAKEVVRLRANDTDAAVLKRSKLKTRLCPKILKKCAKLQKDRQRDRDYYDDYARSSYTPKKPTSIPVVLTKSERCLMKALGALESQHWKKAGSKSACAMKVHAPKETVESEGGAAEGADGAEGGAKADDDESASGSKKSKKSKKKSKKKKKRRRSDDDDE